MKSTNAWERLAFTVNACSPFIYVNGDQFPGFTLEGITKASDLLFFLPDDLPPPGVVSTIDAEPVFVWLGSNGSRLDVVVEGGELFSIEPKNSETAKTGDLQCVANQIKQWISREAPATIE